MYSNVDWIVRLLENAREAHKLGAIKRNMHFNGLICSFMRVLRHC